MRSCVRNLCPHHVGAMGMSRITLPFPLFVAGCVALFAAGINVCLLALAFTGTHRRCACTREAHMTMRARREGAEPAGTSVRRLHHDYGRTWAGRLTCKVQTDPGMYAMNALPSVYVNLKSRLPPAQLQRATRARATFGLQGL